MIQPWHHASDKVRRRQSGQIIVEYVLLLILAFSVAALMTRLMISRDPGNPGFVLKAWQDLVQEVGADHADDIER